MFVENLVRSIAGVWSGIVPPEEHAIGVIIFFLPWALLAHVAYWATGVKELQTLRNLILAGAVALAVCPVVIPLGICYGIYRYFFPPPKKEKGPSPSANKA